jgi:[NiFe] hydrogenase diaphorase moiety large subunit
MLVLEKNALTEEIEVLVMKYGQVRSSLIPILQDIQLQHGCVSDFAQQEIARLLDIHPVEVYGVVTFYSFLSTEPKGRFVFRLCQTISCDLAGKDAIARALVSELGIGFGETSKDKRFTLEYTNCIGMCDAGPALLVNDEVFNKLTPQKVVEIIKNCK